MSAKFVGFFLRLLILMICMLLVLLLCSKETEHPVLVTETMTTRGTFEIEELELELPEVDFNYWFNYAMPGNYRENQSCAQYPDPLEIKLHNNYWQTFQNGNVTMQLYAAYLDRRIAVNSTTGVIRILATANQIGRKFPPTHCQLWFDRYRVPVMSEITEFVSIWPVIWNIKPRLSYPHLLSCKIPYNMQHYTLKTISLTAAPCEHASNSLRVNYEHPSRNFSTENSTLNIAVCLKAFEFPFEDISQRLIEWFELQRIQGASRIYAYIYNVHPAVRKVLHFYQQSGFVLLKNLTMANGSPSFPYYLHTLIKHRLLLKRLNELIPYNDCFYRHMYKHDYILNIDIDEVIMPLGEIQTWSDLLKNELFDAKNACTNGFASLCLRQSLFTINTQSLSPRKELYFLGNTLRRRNYTKENVATKCFHNTLYSLTLHNHYTILSLPGACYRRFLSTQVAQMQHYRDQRGAVETSELLEDRSIWKYSQQLRTAVENVLNKLKT